MTMHLRIGSRRLAAAAIAICCSATTFAASTTGSADKLAPDFTLNDASGKPVKLSDFRGKVVLLNFWATWCGGCKLEIPWFMEFQDQYRNRNFVVLGVSMDEDGWKVVKPFIAQKKINYPILLGNERIAKLYGGLDALPYTVIIDKSGHIAATHAGVPNKNDYKTEIEKLLPRS